MEHFAGLDVSVKEDQRLRVVDDTGRIVRELWKVASEPEALLPVLTNPLLPFFKRIGLEAGPLSQMALQCACRGRAAGDLRRDAAHAGSVLQAQINKTDRNDARGMAQMMRAGLYDARCM